MIMEWKKRTHFTDFTYNGIKVGELMMIMNLNDKFKRISEIQSLEIICKKQHSDQIIIIVYEISSKYFTKY